MAQEPVRNSFAARRRRCSLRGLQTMCRHIARLPVAIGKGSEGSRESTTEEKKKIRQWHLTRNPQQQHLPAASLVSHSSGLVARLIQHSIKLLRTSGPVADLCQTNAVWKASARLCLQQRRRRLRRVADEMCMYSHCRSLLEGSLLDTRHRPVRKESDIACFAFPLLLS